jgi:hypothetical protein
MLPQSKTQTLPKRKPERASATNLDAKRLLAKRTCRKGEQGSCSKYPEQQWVVIGEPVNLSIRYGGNCEQSRCGGKDKTN